MKTKMITPRSNSFADRTGLPLRNTRIVLWLSMHVLPSITVAAILLMGCHAGRAGTQIVEEPRYRIVGYVGGRTEIWRVDASKLTHINYAFAQVNDEGEAYLRNPDAPAHLA